MMKSFNLILSLIIFCLITVSFDVYNQQSYKKMIVGKWQPVLSTGEGIEADGKRTVQNHSNYGSKDIMQFNADGSITDGGQLYFAYSLDPYDDKSLSLFDGGNYEKKFEIVQLDKTTMKIVWQETDHYKGKPFRVILTIVFKRK